MRFNIEIDDFWLEEEEIEQALKSHIITTVVMKVTKSIEDKIDKQVFEKTVAAVNEKLEPVIDAKITDLIASGMISHNRQPISIESHIKKLFETNTGWSANAQIKKFAENFGKEMKLQYNAAFANQIVANMKEQGFLKDEVTQILLGGKS